MNTLKPGPRVQPMGTSVAVALMLEEETPDGMRTPRQIARTYLSRGAKPRVSWDRIFLEGDQIAPRHTLLLSVKEARRFLAALTEALDSVAPATDQGGAS